MSGAHFAHDDAAGGEVLGVICNGPHVLVGVGEVGAHEAIGVRNRALLSQVVPRWGEGFRPNVNRDAVCSSLRP